MMRRFIVIQALAISAMAANAQAAQAGASDSLKLDTDTIFVDIVVAKYLPSCIAEVEYISSPVDGNHH